MNPQEAYQLLEKSAAFVQWKEHHPDVFLLYFFTTLDEQSQQSDWEIGWYSKKTEKATTFVVEAEKKEIVQKADAEIFKEPEAEVEELELGAVKIAFNEALAAVSELKAEFYKEQKLGKGIAILQKLKGVQLWNVTFFTLDVKALNVKVDAGTGKIAAHELERFLG